MAAAMNATDVKLQTRYLRALKTVTEQHLSPKLSRYCLTTFGGETPWSAEFRDGFQGKLLIELLELLAEQRFFAPPFMGNEELVIRMISTLSHNTKVRPVDCRRLFAGEAIPKCVARSCEWVFQSMREEGAYVY